jgi:hypothetical protein
MKKNKFQPLHLVPVVLIAGFLLISLEKPAQEIKREPTSIPKIRKVPKRVTPSQSRISRGPASVPPPRQDLERLIKRNDDVTLSRGHILTTNIGAIPLSEVQPGTTLLWHDGVYGFYQKKPGDKSIPVAYNPHIKKLFPVSSILHVKGVEESDRQKLKDQGYEEYLYFKSIKKISLKSSPDQVVKLYQDLEKQGYKVKIEVLDNRPIAH